MFVGVCIWCLNIWMIVYLVRFGRTAICTSTLSMQMNGLSVYLVPTTSTCTNVNVNVISLYIVYKWVHRFFNTSLTSLCAYLTATNAQPKQKFCFPRQKKKKNWIINEHPPNRRRILVFVIPLHKTIYIIDVLVRLVLSVYSTHILYYNIFMFTVCFCL